MATEMTHSARTVTAAPAPPGPLRMRTPLRCGHHLFHSVYMCFLEMTEDVLVIIRKLHSRSQ